MQQQGLSKLPGVSRPWSSRALSGGSTCGNWAGQGPEARLAPASVAEWGEGGAAVGQLGLQGWGPCLQGCPPPGSTRGCPQDAQPGGGLRSREG